MGVVKCKDVCARVCVCVLGAVRSVILIALI